MNDWMNENKDDMCMFGFFFWFLFSGSFEHMQRYKTESSTHATVKKRQNNIHVCLTFDATLRTQDDLIETHNK